MFTSDEDEIQHVMIGEAAMNLIFSREELSIGSLINQLQSMASVEEDDERLIKIWEARKWLLEFKKVTMTTSARNNWLASRVPHADSANHQADIQLESSAQDSDKHQS